MPLLPEQTASVKTVRTKCHDSFRYKQSWFFRNRFSLFHDSFARHRRVWKRYRLSSSAGTGQGPYSGRHSRHDPAFRMMFISLAEIRNCILRATEIIALAETRLPDTYRFSIIRKRENRTHCPNRNMQTPFPNKVKYTEP